MHAYQQIEEANHYAMHSRLSITSTNARLRRISM
jgi:hypothetical protein